MEKFFDFVTGRRRAQTGKKLWQNIKTINKKAIMTDYRKGLSRAHPQYISKAETYTIESFNSLDTF